MPSVSLCCRSMLTNGGLIGVVEGVIHLAVSTVTRGAEDGISPSERRLTKRVINDVLPTLCSPRKTSLNFLSGEDAARPDAAGGVEVIADDLDPVEQTLQAEYSSTESSTQ